MYSDAVALFLLGGALVWWCLAAIAIWRGIVVWRGRSAAAREGALRRYTLGRRRLDRHADLALIPFGLLLFVGSAVFIVHRPAWTSPVVLVAVVVLLLLTGTSLF